MFGLSENKRIDGAKVYTYGIDKSGQMYIYDKSSNRMVYYGDPRKGAANLSVYQRNGNVLRGEGDQRSSSGGAPASRAGGGGGDSVGGGGGAAKVLDIAQLRSLDSLINSLSAIKDQGIQKAAIKRDTSKREKEAEKKKEEEKYKGKKLTTLQDFSGAKTDTDLNTRDTLENLVSSLSTLGLGGSRALTRQILNAANKSNRKANATQATNNQALDSSWNEYTVGNENDLKKIEDQYGYDAGEATRKFLQDKQSALYKKADVYNAGGDTGGRSAAIGEADSLNSMIAQAAFMNPQYTGEVREMKTPDIASYTQDIAKYDTTGVGASPDGLTPVATDAPNAPGNLAIRAIAVNDKDLGIKKKTEAELGYGV